MDVRTNDSVCRVRVVPTVLLNSVDKDIAVVEGSEVRVVGQTRECHAAMLFTEEFTGAFVEDVVEGDIGG